MADLEWSSFLLRSMLVALRFGGKEEVEEYAFPVLKVFVQSGPSAYCRAVRTRGGDVPNDLARLCKPVSFPVNIAEAEDLKALKARARMSRQRILAFQTSS